MQYNQNVFKKGIILFVPFILFLVSCGSENSVSAGSDSMTTSVATDHGEHDHGEHGSGGDGHHSDEDVIDLSSIKNPPNISLVAIPDDKGGVTLDIELENFELVPLDAKGENQPREGHLHVELDGRMVAMLSERNHYLSDLSNGHHEIVVSLSSVDHRSFSFNGELIADTTTVMISGGNESDFPDASFEVKILEGEVKGGLSRFEVSKGDLVEITVYSDKNDEVHLHVYDDMVSVGPDAPAVINVEATIPGIFEAELHSAGFRIFELQVS